MGCQCSSAVGSLIAHFQFASPSSQSIAGGAAYRNASVHVRSSGDIATSRWMVTRHTGVRAIHLNDELRYLQRTSLRPVCEV